VFWGDTTAFREKRSRGNALQGKNSQSLQNIGEFLRKSFAKRKGSVRGKCTAMRTRNRPKEKKKKLNNLWKRRRHWGRRSPSRAFFMGNCKVFWEGGETCGEESIPPIRKKKRSKNMKQGSFLGKGGNRRTAWGKKVEIPRGKKKSLSIKGFPAESKWRKDESGPGGKFQGKKQHISGLRQEEKEKGRFPNEKRTCCPERPGQAF